jgi:TRAP-type mannitol/chloroaromatic compound transport system permease small subunit
MRRFLFAIDQFSAWIGKAFAWCILVLTLGTSYEVFVRYLLRAPTVWAYDVSYVMYAGLFMMAGGYTLSRNGHVRGDFFYRLWRPRWQAATDLILYFLFLFPAALALMYSGWGFAKMSWLLKEVSVFSPAGVPVFQVKTLIPAAGFVLLVQGIAEAIRCIICLRTGAWPQRLHDVEEIEAAMLRNLQTRAAGQSDITGTPNQGERR